MSTLAWCLALGSVATGAAIQGSLGFGLGMLCAPILALLDPDLVPGPLLMMGLFASVWVAWRERAGFEFSRIAWALVGRVIGTAIGVSVLVVVSDQVVLGVLAVATLAGVALSVGGWKIQPTPPAMVVAGAASGVMGLLTSIGGPPMALVLQNETGARLRSTLSGFFVIGASMALASLAVSGGLDSHDLRLGAALAPAALVGLITSTMLARFLDAGWVRRVVLGISGVTAALLLFEVTVLGH
jgi:uncharacterized membrane protein YfcA